MNPADGIVPTGDIPANVSAIRLAGLIRDDSPPHPGQLVDADCDAARVSCLSRNSRWTSCRRICRISSNAILEAVSVSPYEFDPMPMETVARKAATHGVTRANSFPIDVVLSEIQTLQREVRNAIWRNAQEMPVAVIHELDERLNEVFELAERSVVGAWVRRYEEMPTPLRRGDAA